MKVRLAPVFFNSADDPEFLKQLNNLRELLKEEVEFLEPVKLGSKVPDTDGVIFPQMLGEAFRLADKIAKLPQPLLVVTSEFGTVSMWDWEINSYLAAKGIQVIGPTSLEKTKKACRAFALRRQLKQSSLLVYQDNPANGTGKQDAIFKRFYWWEDECISGIEKNFGVKVEKRSFKELAERAKKISDEKALEVWNMKKTTVPVAGLSNPSILSAIKMYMALRTDLESRPNVLATGMNCLNESMYSDTTPCLAWNLLYEEQGMVWGCEGDLVSMLTKVLIGKTLAVPFMMTNLYPFQMGYAALKHENIPHFPQVDGSPDDYILAAHCGYFGVVPRSFSTEWKLQKKVLAIVDDNATAIDARLPEGEITLVKLMPPFNRWSVVQGNLTKYAQFKNSDCLNGAVIKVPDGKKLVADLASHHYIITTGHNQNDLDMVSKVFNLTCETC